MLPAQVRWEQIQAMEEAPLLLNGDGEQKVLPKYRLYAKQLMAGVAVAAMLASWVASAELVKNLQKCQVNTTNATDTGVCSPGCCFKKVAPRPLLPPPRRAVNRPHSPFSSAGSLASRGASACSAGPCGATGSTRAARGSGRVRTAHSRGRST